MGQSGQTDLSHQSYSLQYNDFMLFVLTGDIQIGKSRWLAALDEELTQSGVTCLGVIAPGVWVESDGVAANDQGFEKLGIDNLLLPGHALVPFARRVDLARKEGSYAANSQAGRAGLGWHISDAALERVNRHLASLPERAGATPGPKLLVVDELGRLELDCDGGLVEAMALLHAGPQAAMKDALVVARDVLAGRVEALFAETWGGSTRIAPDEAGRELVRKRLCPTPPRAS